MQTPGSLCSKNGWEKRMTWNREWIFVIFIINKKNAAPVRAHHWIGTKLFPLRFCSPLFSFAVLLKWLRLRIVGWETEDQQEREREERKKKESERNKMAEPSKSNHSLMEWGCGSQTNGREANDSLVGVKTRARVAETLNLHKNAQLTCTAETFYATRKPYTWTLHVRTNTYTAAH